MHGRARRSAGCVDPRPAAPAPPPPVRRRHPRHQPEAEALSKALRARGWRFVGPTIVYAFMQAVGVVDDHLEGCHRAG